MEKTIKALHDGINIGPKQDTGSIRNNKPLEPVHDMKSNARFTSETRQR
jgi:hypothetical protein